MTSPKKRKTPSGSSSRLISGSAPSMKVMESILKFQRRPIFERGPVYSQTADPARCGRRYLHARIHHQPKLTSNKYVHTPRGIELKHVLLHRHPPGGQGRHWRPNRSRPESDSWSRRKTRPSRSAIAPLPPNWPTETSSTARSPHRGQMRNRCIIPPGQAPAPAALSKLLQ